MISLRLKATHMKDISTVSSLGLGAGSPGDLPERGMQHVDPISSRHGQMVKCAHHAHVHKCRQSSIAFFSPSCVFPSSLPGLHALSGETTRAVLGHMPQSCAGVPNGRYLARKGVVLMTEAPHRKGPNAAKCYFEKVAASRSQKR